MEFRILGPLEIADDRGDPVEIGSGRERALLILLVLHANEVLSSDRIVDDLWPGEAPDTANKIVQLYVSRLRKSLGDRRELLETRGSGYVLRLPPGSTDTERVERLVSDSAKTPDPATRASLLGDALSAWRGQPLADVEYDAFATHEAARLAEWRVGIVEERIAAELETGHGPELVPELDALVRANPLRERLRGQHMHALYRAGRQAEALASYRELRELLDEQLGLEPSSDIRELERRILRHDPDLGAPPAASREPVAGTRPVVLVAAYDGDLDEAAELARTLVHVDVERELLLARLVAAPELAEATRSLSTMRDALARDGVVVRVAAFTSLDPAHDLVRLADVESAELVLARVGAAVIDEVVTALLELAPCDVALQIAGSTHGAGPVMVPFGGGRHDWAALELGAWLARGSGSTLQLVGAASDDPEHRDASRLLADASLVVQRATGVVAEPVLSRPGAEVAEVARTAGALVIGLPDTWRDTGLGPVRESLAASPPALLLFAHRGTKPTEVASPLELSRYAWSVEWERPATT